MELDQRAQISIWQQKVIAGTITKEELRDALAVLRAGRKGAQEASIRKRQAGTKTPSKDVDTMLDELDNL